MPDKITLFTDKSNCCGCCACAQVCPKNAIEMQEDECGYIYPKINEDKCVGCKLCQKACNFQNKTENNNPIKTYAAAAVSMETKKNSASGGIFYAASEKILEKNGVVFGAAFDNEFNVHHICADNEKKLKLLQGSKYVQSNTDGTYQQAKSYLTKGVSVLYSGTPCQIAGLYGYLGKDYDNLLTMDLICHGVPNVRMFKDYIKTLGNVESFSFRDKSIGWGINGSAVINNGEKRKKIKIWRSASPYLYYFLNCLIFRECCYSCKYTCSHRPADITIGDYWGIEKQHPEYLEGKIFDERYGISVVIANTQKGLEFIEQCGGLIEMKDSDFSKASAGNPQLVKPSHADKRHEILDVYRKGGWNALEKRFNKNIGLKKHAAFIKAHIPQKIKRILKVKG